MVNTQFKQNTLAIHTMILKYQYEMTQITRTTNRLNEVNIITMNPVTNISRVFCLIRCDNVGKVYLVNRVLLVNNIIKVLCLDCVSNMI